MSLFRGSSSSDAAAAANGTAPLDIATPTFLQHSNEARLHRISSCQSTDLGARADHASCETLAVLHGSDAKDVNPMALQRCLKESQKLDSCLYDSSCPCLEPSNCSSVNSVRTAVSAGVCAANAASQVFTCAAPTDHHL